MFYLCCSFHTYVQKKWLQFIECFVLLNSIKIISQRVFSLQMVWIAGNNVSGYDNNDNKYHKLWVHLAQSDMYMTLYFEMSLPCAPPSLLTFWSSSCFLTILEPFNLPNSMNSLRQLKSNSFWRPFVTYLTKWSHCGYGLPQLLACGYEL